MPSFNPSMAFSPSSMTRRYAHCSVYSTKGERPYWRVVPFKDGAGILGFLPNLRLTPLFDNTVSSDYPKPFIRSAIVMVPGHRFLVVGYRHPNRPINKNISKLGTDLVWRGEVAVFHIGWTVPYLASPSTKKLRDDAVVVFVTRTTEAFATGRKPPTLIQYV